MTYDYEQKGRDDFAAGIKNERLYAEGNAGGEAYRRGWQLARLAAPDDGFDFSPQPEEPPPPAALTRPPEPRVAEVAPPPPRPAPPEPAVLALAPVPVDLPPAAAPVEAPADVAPADPDQLALFDLPADWEKDWKGMPQFAQKDLEPWGSLTVHFKNRQDRNNFSKLIGQTITDDTRSLWIPKAEITRYVDKRFSVEEKVNPTWPIYIVSKGRYEVRLTSDSLDAMGIPHFVVVEESELELYRARVKPTATLLVLPVSKYKGEYELCDALGLTKSTGPGPARNFAWDHSLAAGHAWHWVMDDNIDGFYRLHNNIKTPASTGAIFRAMEDFVARYSNVGMAGPNYFMFASRKCGAIKPFTLNTRIYSCNLIRNDVPYRWRGRYNEDTDLSLRMLIDGLCTVQFNAFLQYKITTQTLGGGNTAEFYAKEGTRAKSEMLVAMHPTLARVTERFGRIHHHVNYRIFLRNELKLRDGVEVPSAANNYGMRLEMLDDATGQPFAPPEEVDEQEQEEEQPTHTKP